MPGMYEIYETHAVAYDELVDREDADGALAEFVCGLVAPGARVLEAGAGTGRVTAFYAGAAASVLACDRSAHMLARARDRLAPFGAKVGYLEADNLSLGGRVELRGRFDVGIEGWSFGHTVSDLPEAEAETCDALVEGLAACLAPGGRICLLETLGTNLAAPRAPAPFLERFYERLERVHGFTRTLLRTDYAFPSLAEARRICGFFFGEAMAASIRGARVPEWTGAWVRPS